MVFVWAIIILLLVTIIFMPKRLTLKENIIIIPTVGYFAWISHIIIGVMVDLLDFGPTKEVGITDWVLVTFVPSLIAVVFLNFKKTDKILAYALVWTVLSAVVEFVLTKSEYMKYHGWSIWYSIPIYFLAYLILTWYYKLIVKK